MLRKVLAIILILTLATVSLAFFDQLDRSDGIPYRKTIVFQVFRSYDFDGLNKSFTEFYDYNITLGAPGQTLVYVTEPLQDYVVVVNSSTGIVETGYFTIRPNQTLDVGQGFKEGLYLIGPLPHIGVSLDIQNKTFRVSGYSNLNLRMGDFKALVMVSNSSYTLDGVNYSYRDTYSYDTANGVALVQENLLGSVGPSGYFFSNDTSMLYSY